MTTVDVSKAEIVAISREERSFFVQLGTRVAELRKAQGITQVQLAEALEVSQQTVNAYELGHRRIPVSTLPSLAKILAVTVEDLLGGSDATPSRRGPAPKLQQQIERIQRLPRAKQRFVMEMIDTVLAQQSR